MLFCTLFPSLQCTTPINKTSKANNNSKFSISLAASESQTTAHKDLGGWIYRLSIVVLLKSWLDVPIVTLFLFKLINYLILTPTQKPAQAESKFNTIFTWHQVVGGLNGDKWNSTFKIIIGFRVRIITRIGIKIRNEQIMGLW